MDRIRCFVLIPTPRGRRALRRYVSVDSDKCPVTGWYHDAETVLDDFDFPIENNLDGDMTQPWSKDDPNWPVACKCGRKFNASDEYQHAMLRLYKRSDNGVLLRLQEAPVGAMWNADWLPQNYRGPDGWCLVVNTPGGQWAVDGPPEGQRTGCWQRTGTPPDVTATPSILIRNPDGTERYHGWLRNGWLERC
jgi:hypothetical protein